MSSKTIYTEEYVPYSYFVKWSNINVWYYGIEYSKITKIANPKNLWNTYFTSSKTVWEYRKLFGEPDIIKVSKIFKTRDEAIRHETKFLNRVNAKRNKNSLNLHNSDGLRHINHNILKSTRKLLSESHRKKKWWTNGVDSIHIEQCPGNDYYRGRVFKNNPGAKLGAEANKNKRWYTNGVNSIFVECGTQPNEYNLGRKIGKTNCKDKNKRRWYNDGTKSYHLSPERNHLISELNLVEGRVKK